MRGTTRMTPDHRTTVRRLRKEAADEPRRQRARSNAGPWSCSDPHARRPLRRRGAGGGGKYEGGVAFFIKELTHEQCWK